MRNSTKRVMALALILAAIMGTAGGVNRNFSADVAALPFAATPGSEKPVRATKGDRLDVHPDIRKIAGVTLVLRDLDTNVR